MKLLEDLFTAYYDARRNKRNTREQLEFELNLEDNLLKLYNELNERRYKIGQCRAFIINDPVKREIFAASFSDRVIHHLYFNYVNNIFEQTFISDSYSCRKGKGTMWGIKRLDHHLRSCSDNFTRECYVLKLDISGYFMAINRNLLLDKVLKTLQNHEKKRYKVKFAETDLPDYELLIYLSRILILHNPIEDCIIKSRSTEWNGLPRDKSLFFASKGCGLPIGNLTSQLFSNIYLNEFDHYMKRVLKVKHYGRYVDDFYIVENRKRILTDLIVPIRDFLKSNLGLTLHPRKIYLQRIEQGVPFLGTHVKPYRIYTQKRTINNFKQLLIYYNSRERKAIPRNTEQRINSYLGLLKHYKTMNIRRSLLRKYCGVFRYGKVSVRLQCFRTDPHDMYTPQGESDFTCE